MTDSMNFGPEWLRNLSSDGSTTGGTGGAVRYQLSGYRYGREEMLGLYEKGFKPPASLSNFTTLYSEQPLVPLVLTPTTEEERMWQNRPPPINPSIRGSRGSSLERGGRGSRGRGAYNSYGRNVGYENTGGPGGGWGNGEQQEWSPRKDYNYSRSASVDNWRRNQRPDEDDGWRSASTRGGGSGGGGGGGTTSVADKWGRSTSWRDGDKEDDRGGPQHDRNNRSSWHDGSGGRGGGHPQQRRGWEDDHPQPEWFTEQLGEGGGTFDSSGAYHGSDEEQEMREREQHRGGGTPGRKELQKSASQQNISPRHPPSLSSSKSSGSLSKQMENDIKEEMVLETSLKDVQDPKDRQDPPEKFKSESDRLNINSSDQKLSSRSDRRDNDDLPHHNIGVSSPNMNINGIISNQGLTNRVEEDFDRLQEDLVSKLVVEEERPKPTLPANISIPGVGVAPQQPPPNLVPPIQDKWYYQDPQGDLQGPFVSTEMAEWFKAGYFTLSLLVRRRCDKSFYTLGDLVTICNGGNPFLSTTVIPPLKEPPPPVKKDLLNLQYLQAQMALRQVAPRAYNPAEWANLSPMQRDLLSQHMMPPQHPQMSPVELQYLQQPPQQTPTNPLMHMISQMQQVNKLPGQTMSDQPQNSLPMQMDPLQALVQQMHSLQRIQPPGANIPGMGLPPNIPSDNLMGMAGVHGALPAQGLGPANMAGLAGGIPGHSGPIPGPVSQTTLDGLTIPNDDNPINTLLRQLQSKNIQPSQQMESMWQQNQFVPPHTQSNNQWQQQSQPQQQQHQQQPIPQPSQTQQPIQPQPNDPSLSMWDLPQTMPTTSMPKPNIPTEAAIPTPHQQSEEHPQQPKDKEASRKEKEREDRKKKEQEEKQLKKEAEEKRKQEQRRQELEKKAAEEKKRKEEERIKKELEKAKKEAEEKRQRELEEKRRLKEQRKAEEEARKKAEEQKKLDDQEKERQKEEQARRQAEMAKQSQENTTAKIGKIAPWSQSNVNSGPSLADIQKAEREKRLAEAMIQQQQRAQQIQEQQTIEKASIQLSWANKPIQPRQVKSLAEIQAEEQEKLAKQAAERLAQQQREKETNTSSVSTGIWQGQNLTWANTASQWSSNNSGFWDDVPSQKPISKPSNIVKSNSTSAMVAPPKQPQQQPPKQVKVKPKKEESLLTTTTTTTTSRNNNMNGPASEEFTQWCIRALSNVASTVDIPTFIGFLKDIESAAEVKDYCRDYLGESPAMHQFMAQFLEKRRSFKPKTNAHKDDMCAPAPAITPSSQHNCEFQEVKGKGKKCKKSKMTKVDARILGFNVTAAQDRINVGDRDYGDN